VLPGAGPRGERHADPPDDQRHGGVQEQRAGGDSHAPIIPCPPAGRVHPRTQPEYVPRRSPRRPPTCGAVARRPRTGRLRGSGCRRASSA
jgi:hypothetical protein